MDIDEVTWRYQGEILEIRFTNGAIDWYEKVPRDVYARLVESTEPEEVFSREIESHYPLIGIRKWISKIGLR